MQAEPQVSIVIPVAPAERQWKNLLACLTELPWVYEILLVGTEPATDDLPEFAAKLDIANCLSWLQSEPGRARQLNCGAAAAIGRFVWFLHADTVVPSGAITALDHALQCQPKALHYFQLKFRGDGPHLMKLNAGGVWFRSRWLGMPFGDQGFCIERTTFRDLGGYDETAQYGEDHLFVWKARQNNIRLNGIPEPIQTSARKYRKHGWLRTTCRHVILTFRQAIPQFWRLIRKRIHS